MTRSTRYEWRRGQPGCPACSKKTIELLVEQGNDYLVTVKGNQPKLMQHFQDALAEQPPLSVDESLDLSHGRQVKRVVQVFAAPPALTAGWKQAQSLVVVERSGLRDAHRFETTSFYLSSLAPNALELGLGVRTHRDIENGLHWVRDVVFKEDAAPFVDLRTALNWSLMRTIALNLFRAKGYSSLTRAIRLLGNDLGGLLSLLTKN